MEHDSIKDLKEIRSIMEQTTRILSLSGKSGVWAGSVGLIGAAIAYKLLQNTHHAYTTENINSFILIGVVVLILAFCGGLFFTFQKNKDSQKPIWNRTSKQLIFQLATPLFCGGLFCFIFIQNQLLVYIAPTCLIFYGLSLISASKYTYTDVKYLGICELCLGMGSLLFLGYGLLFWVIGFGFLHIFYGLIMWKKHDQKKSDFQS